MVVQLRASFVVGSFAGGIDMLTVVKLRDNSNDWVPLAVAVAAVVAVAYDDKTDDGVGMEVQLTTNRNYR